MDVSVIVRFLCVQEKRSILFETLNSPPPISLLVNAETPCVRFYHPQRKGGELLQLCTGIVCTCAEGKSGWWQIYFFVFLCHLPRHKNTKGSIWGFISEREHQFGHNRSSDRYHWCAVHRFISTSAFFFNFSPLVPENCSMQKADKVNNFERTDYLCVTTPVTKIDFGEHQLLLQ